MLKKELKSEFEEFFNILPKDLEFSVMLYSKTEKHPEIVRFKLGLSEDVQATLKCRLKDYGGFLETKNIKLYFTGLFRKEMVKGDITLSQILHDAKPSHISMESFFKTDPNSKYGSTQGLHCGKIITEKQEKGLVLKIKDLNELKNISGMYTLNETGKYFSFYGTSSKELSLKKKK